MDCQICWREIQVNELGSDWADVDLCKKCYEFSLEKAEHEAKSVIRGEHDCGKERET